MRRSNIHHALYIIIGYYCSMTPRARTSEFPTAIAIRGGTEFRSQVFLGASVHGYIFIGSSVRSQTA